MIYKNDIENVIPVPLGVIPAKAGIQSRRELDSRPLPTTCRGKLRGNDRQFISIILLLVFLVSCATAFDSRGRYHRVSGNETIQILARYYHVPVQELAELNNIQDQGDLVPGLKIYIPENKDAGASRHKKLPKSESAKFDSKIEVDRSKFAWPVDGALMSPFGIRNGRRHDGVDIKAKSGTPINSAAKGEVVFSGVLRGYGKVVIIKHPDHFFTVYAHNSKNKVEKGQKVAKGAVIGYVGATGRATGPHLHFEVREGDGARNPLFFLPAVHDTGVMVASADKDTTVKKKKKGKKVKEEPAEELGEKSEDKSVAVEKTDSVKKDTADKWARRKAMLEELKTKRKK